MNMNWQKLAVTALIVSAARAVFAQTATPPVSSSSEVYRALTMKVRPAANFKIPMPNGVDTALSYKFTWADPLWQQPITSDIHDDIGSSGLSVLFWDKIFFQADSTLAIGGENLPLTCVYVDGQDNRASSDHSPLLPQFLMKVYLVANDFACDGPINKGWPENGLRKERWDTYLYYEIRDPTIMLPTEVKVRFRWNEYFAVLVTQPGETHE